MTNVHFRNRIPLPNGAGDGTNRKRCVIYLRVSSREQAEEGYSISAQREACRRLIEDRGWTLVDEYVDAGESARTSDRPALREMLDRIAEDESVDCLVVHKLDRLARNLEDHVMVRAKLRKASVELVSVSENLEESASGKLVEGILASIAEFYSANLSQEIRKGMGEKARQGGWPRPAPIGYRNVRLPSNGRRGEALIVPDESQAHLIRQTFELYATGEWPLTRLHGEMMKRGLRTPRGSMVGRSSLAKLLQSRVYLGKVSWDGVEYEGSHEPLVSTELFDQVQDVLRVHDRAGERQRRHSHYLKGTLFCGTCGSRLSTTNAKGRTYFYCLAGRQHRTSCDERYVSAEALERQVEALYREIRLPRKLRDAVMERLETELAKREEDRERSRDLWSKRLRRLTTEREKLLRAHYDEAVPLDLFKKEQERIAEETARANEHLAASDRRAVETQETIELAKTLTTNCHRAYRHASSITRRRYNQAFLRAVGIQDREVVTVEYAEPFEEPLGRQVGA